MIPIVQEDTVKVTSKKCYRGLPHNPTPFVFLGTIKQLDTNKNEITVTIHNGEMKDFYYLPSDQHATHPVALKDLSVGKQVSVSGKVDGRAETIAILPDEYKAR